MKCRSYDHVLTNFPTSIKEKKIPSRDKVVLNQTNKDDGVTRSDKVLYATVISFPQLPYLLYL